MKTNALNIIATRVIAIVVALTLGINLSSCGNASDEPASLSDNTEKVTSAHVTFTYTVPEELFKYAEITVVYNNNAGTDAKWEPVLDPTFTVTYDVTSFPMTMPVVMVFDRTNRPAKVNVDWDLNMDIEVAMNIGGRTEIKHHSTTYNLAGDAEQGINTLGKNVLDRTWGVKIAKNGNVQFVR